MTQTVFCTAATADRTDADIGLIWWATGVEGYALEILDYELHETEAINAAWIGEVLARCAELASSRKPAQRGCFVRVEHPGLTELLRRAEEAFSHTNAADRVDSAQYAIRPVKEYEAAKWPTTFDERAYAIRPLVESNKVIRPATRLRRFSWNAIYTNHLAAQVARHKPGAPASELVVAFTLGVLLGTTPQRKSFFDFMDRGDSEDPSSDRFGPYVPGPRPL